MKWDFALVKRVKVVISDSLRWPDSHDDDGEEEEEEDHEDENAVDCRQRAEMRITLQ